MMRTHACGSREEFEIRARICIRRDLAAHPPHQVPIEGCGLPAPDGSGGTREIQPVPQLRARRTRSPARVAGGAMGRMDGNKFPWNAPRKRTTPSSSASRVATASRYLRRLPAGKIDRCFARFFTNVAFPFSNQDIQFPPRRAIRILRSKFSKPSGTMPPAGPLKGYY